MLGLGYIMPMFAVQLLLSNNMNIECVTEIDFNNIYSICCLRPLSTIHREMSNDS